MWITLWTNTEKRTKITVKWAPNPKWSKADQVFFLIYLSICYGLNMTIYENLDEYDLILTPNERLCGYINSRHDHFLHSQGHLVWEPLPIYSVNRWLLKHIQSHNHYLSPYQMLMHWKTCCPAPLLSHLAPLAHKAWELCFHWQVDMTDALFLKNDDTRFFKAWAQNSNLKIPNLDYLLSSIPAKVCLIGFGESAEFTLLEKKLFNQAEKKNLTKTPKTIIKTSFNDSDQELKKMAIWATQQPENSITGCVIPNLHLIRDKVDYYFDAYFNEHKSRYTISAGKYLSDYPLIKDALHFLNTTNKCILNNNTNNSYTPSYWANLFQQQLKSWVLPGTRALNSEEYQLIDHFHDAFSTYESLDGVTSHWPVQEALTELTLLCQSIIFQPQSSPDVRVHILGTLESAGLNFDSLWVMGLHDKAWPSTPNQNPFIPFAHACADQELRFSQNITAQWHTAADTLIFSYPEADSSDGNILKPSVLINDFTNNINNHLIITPLLTPAEKKIGLAQTESIVDKKAPELNLAVLKHHGSSIFTDQAACPFRAFAHHRLNAKKIELPQLGFKALQKGNIIHAIMENIWKIIQSHENLILYFNNKSSLCDLIDSTIDNTLKKYYTIIPEKIFFETEKIRLHNIIFTWLEHEKNRDPFTVIATEEKIETQLGNLPLKLRIDRIDKIHDLHNNTYLIIDYKTGKHNVSPDPLDDPQLPLYSVVSALSVDSIGYAYIRTKQAKLTLKSIQGLKSQWEESLIRLAQGFIAGEADVNPKYGLQTCRLCDLKPLCRIKPQ